MSNFLFIPPQQAQLDPAALFYFLQRALFLIDQILLSRMLLNTNTEKPMTKQTLVNNLFSVVGHSPSIASNRAERVEAWAKRLFQRGERVEACQTAHLAKALQHQAQLADAIANEDTDAIIEAARHITSELNAYGI
jgi:hypothetical protein